MSRASALNWSIMKCLLAVCLLTGCAGPRPFAGEGVEVVSIDVFPIENREVSASALVEGLVQGENFRKLTSLMLNAPDRWQYLGGVVCFCIPTHCLYFHLRDGKTVQVWTHGSDWKAHGWKLQLTEDETTWFFEEVQWHDRETNARAANCLE